MVTLFHNIILSRNEKPDKVFGWVKTNNEIWESSYLATAAYVGNLRSASSIHSDGSFGVPAASEILEAKQRPAL